MKTRPRSCGERERWKISWITRLAGSVGRVGLAGEDDLDRPVGVPEQPGQPVDVGEQQAGPLVGREPAGEADRHDRRVERVVELGQDRRRLAVAGELAAQPAAGEDRQLALLAEVRLPQVARPGCARGAPRSGPASAPASRSSRSASRWRSSSSTTGEPTQVGAWTPLVMPRIGCSMTSLPGRVRGLGVQLADRVRAVGQAQAERRHVELAAVAVRAEPELQDAARPARRPASSSGPATRRTRSASKRSLPAETGVWMVNTLSRRTRRHASSSGRPGADVLAGALGEQERGVALVEVPDRRVQPERADGAHAADAEDELLVEPHLAAADVQDVGDRAVLDRRSSATSVSRSRTGTRPTWASQTATDRSRPGSSTRDRQRQAVASWTRDSGSRVRS